MWRRTGSDGDETQGCRATPRAVGTILAPFDAIFELGWRGRQLNFTVALSSFGGVVGMAKIEAAQKKDKGLTKTKERKSLKEREIPKKMFCCLFLGS